LDKCAYSGDFVSKEALSTDGQGNCELGPFSIHPVATVDDGDCKGNYPKLDVKIKIIAVNKDELRIYFSQDEGKTYYNEDDPRLAIRIVPEHDADGMNSGGSSSKGGKKGTNDRRRLVEAAKAQLQRKLQCEEETKCFGDRAELKVAVDTYVGLGCQYFWNKARCEDFFVKTKGYGYGLPMNNWCVDHVTDMSNLFRDMYEFNEDISNWNTGKVTNMRGMFTNARKFNRDLSKWNTGKVTNMHGMFAAALAFNQDISSWDISQVTDIEYMFYYTESFNQDLCKWADKFPYYKAFDIFYAAKGCDYQDDPEKENGGPFCASDCKS
jgi:surface protein